MYLTADIGHFIDPVAKTSYRAGITARFLSFIDSLQEKAVNKVIKELDYCILALEGMMNRVEKLNAKQAQGVIENITLAVVRFDKITKNIASFDYFESKEVKDRVKYTQKCLYKIESKLHRKIYREKNISSTPKEFKDGISKLNAVYSS